MRRLCPKVSGQEAPKVPLMWSGDACWPFSYPRSSGSNQPLAGLPGVLGTRVPNGRVEGIRVCLRPRRESRRFIREGSGGAATHQTRPGARFIEYFREGRGVSLRLYLAQQFIEGTTLRARTREAGPFDDAGVAALLTQLLHIADYLHTLLPSNMPAPSLPRVICMRLAPPRSTQSPVAILWTHGDTARRPRSVDSCRASHC